MLINPFIAAHIESTLGPRPEERKPVIKEFDEQSTAEGMDYETPFYERDEQDQEDLFYKIESLVAERRRLTRDLTKCKEETEEEDKKGFIMKKVGSRYVRIPVKHPVQRKTYRSEAVQQSLDRLKKIKDDLYNFGQIPGLHEAYEKKLTYLYYYMKMTRAYERMKSRIAEIDQLLYDLYTESQVANGGAVTGVNLAQAEHLENEKLDLQNRVRIFEGYDPKIDKMQEALKDITNHKKGIKESQKKLIDTEKSLAGNLEKLAQLNAQLADMKRQHKAASLAQPQDVNKINDLKSRIKEINNEIAEIETQNKEFTVQIALLKNATENAEEDLKQLDANETEIQIELEKNEPIRAAAEFLYRHHQLREYANEAAAGRMVMIPSAERLTEDGLEQIWANQPLLLSGHLGSGKTEMARHIAKTWMLQNGRGYDPEVEDPNEVYDRLHVEIFSGSEDSSIYDLIGKLKLTGRSASDPKFIREHVEKIKQGLGKNYKDIPDEEIAKMILGKSDITETIFAYGPLGRAIRDDVPLILDEVNMIPPEVLGGINDILLKKVGSQISLQQNGEERLTRGPGFCVIATCNFGDIYTGTTKMNAAFKSRYVMRNVEYPTLEENYDLILASLVQKDRLHLPPRFPVDQYDALARLAVSVHEIQEIFSGKTEGRRFMAMSNSAGAVRASLEENVISTRDLMKKIVSRWKELNFNQPLEEIIAKNILASIADNPEEQKFIAEIFMRRGFFKGWSEDQFRKIGVTHIHQREIDALTAVMGTDDYKQSDEHFGKLLDEAVKNMKSLKRHLMVETQQAA